MAARAFVAGLVTYPSGGCATVRGGDVVMPAPPFLTSEVELDEMATSLERALRFGTLSVPGRP